MGVVEVVEHVTKEGDRWDLLAWEYYGDATAYEEIVAANPDVTMSPMLPSGIKLLIPVREKAENEATESLPPWKR